MKTRRKSLADRKLGAHILLECLRHGVVPPVRIQKLLESGQGLTSSDSSGIRTVSVRDLAARLAREATAASSDGTLMRPETNALAGIRRRRRYATNSNEGEVGELPQRGGRDDRRLDNTRHVPQEPRPQATGSVYEDEAGDAEYGGDYDEFVGKEPGDEDAIAAGLSHVRRDLELVARLYADEDSEDYASVMGMAQHIDEMLGGAEPEDKEEDETGTGDDDLDLGSPTGDGDLWDALETPKTSEDVPTVPPAGQRLRASLRERFTDAQRDEVTRMILDEMEVGYLGSHARG